MDITGVAVSFNHDITDLKINPDNTHAATLYWDNTGGRHCQENWGNQKTGVVPLSVSFYLKTASYPPGHLKRQI